MLLLKEQGCSRRAAGQDPAPPRRTGRMLARPRQGGTFGKFPGLTESALGCLQLCTPRIRSPLPGPWVPAEVLRRSLHRVAPCR